MGDLEGEMSTAYIAEKSQVLNNDNSHQMNLRYIYNLQDVSNIRVTDDSQLEIWDLQKQVKSWIDDNENEKVRCNLLEVSLCVGETA